MTQFQIPYSLAGRTALITGASSGFGERFARLYAAAGANVVFGARRLDRIELLAAEIEAAGGRALAVPLDVTDEASVVAAFDAAESRFGAPDVVVANAGTSAAGRSTEVPLSGIRSVVDTNFTGLYLTAREGAKRMLAAGSKDNQRGRIILLGSITAMMSGQGDTAYAALKAGVAHLGRQFAREWARSTNQYARIQNCPKGGEKRQNSGVFQNGEIWRFSNFTPKTANIFSTTSGPEMG